MKLTEEQEKLQTHWNSIREAYHTCPQSMTLDTICSYNSLEELYNLVVDHCRSNIYHVLFDLGYYKYLQLCSKQIINEYFRRKSNLIKDILENR